MALVASKVALKAKLVQKGRLRPHNMIRKKMPDGTGLLDDLPVRARGAAEDDEPADVAYCHAIDKVTKVLGNQMRSYTRFEKMV